MMPYIKFSSRLIEDLYTDTCSEGYRQMILGLVEIIDKFPRNLEIEDYHTILSKLSFCYSYSEEWDQEFQRTIYMRERYEELWERVIETTDTLLEIWPQVLCRRPPDDYTIYFGNWDYLHVICTLTR